MKQLVWGYMSLVMGLLLWSSGLAQAPYRGGEGDGFAQVEALLASGEAPPATIKVWPQPMRRGGRWRVSGLPAIEDLQAEIWDVQGRRCWQGELRLDEAQPVPALPAGWYVLRLHGRRGRWHLPLGIE